MAMLPLVVVLAAQQGVPPAAGSPPYCGPAPGETEGQWREKMLAFRRSFTNSSSAAAGGGAFCSTDPASLYHRNKDFVGSTFTCTLTMLSDRYLYNEATHQWTVGRFLGDLEERYGGADCVLLWQSYTNMGVDEKNQIDLIRVAPGGVAGVKAMIAQLHAANVSVLFPWNQWASGNLSFGPRAEPDFDFVQLLAEVAADGFNTDSGGRSAIPGQKGYKPSQPAVHGFDGNTFVAHGLANFPMGFNKHDLLNQPEHGAGCPAGLTMGGWAGEGAGPGPGYNGLGSRAAACVECAKWLEPRHKTQWVGRNDVLRQPALKWAFFNGNGYSTWESVWGEWNGISEKDGETMRRIFTILRQFQQHVSSCDFRPFLAVKASTRVEARATLFPLVNASSGVTHEWLLTVISNTASPTSDTPLGSYHVTVPAGSSRGSAASASRFFDVWQGRELHPATMQYTGADGGEGGGGGGSAGAGSGMAASGDNETVSLHLTGQLDEYSAVAMVTAETAATPAFASFLAKMRNLTATPLGPLSAAQVPSFDYHFNVNGDVIGTNAEELITAAAAATATDRSAETLSPPLVPPVATVHVPLTHGFHFQVQNLLWENYLFVKYPFGPQKVQKMDAGVVATVHSNLTVGAFEIDKYPVTNEEFASFLAASNYTPADPTNFLKNWDGTTNATSGHQKRTPPIGSEKKPVVHVGFEDAQRYCSFYKRRLPNEWEWSLAAGAFDNRRWPWGNSSETAAGQQCMPPSYNGLDSPPLPDVTQFDKHGCGAPSGMQLSVGSIWQWTNSLQDAHQRTGLIKGGSTYWRANVTKERSVYFFPNCAKEQWDGYGGRAAKIMPLACQGELYLQDGGSERSSTIGFRCAAAAGPLQFLHHLLHPPRVLIHRIVEGGT
jgi:iron(II)-dependent oxidoreductase